MVNTVPLRVRWYSALLPVIYSRVVRTELSGATYRQQLFLFARLFPLLATKADEHTIDYVVYFIHGSLYGELSVWSTTPKQSV